MTMEELQNIGLPAEQSEQLHNYLVITTTTTSTPTTTTTTTEGGGCGVETRVEEIVEGVEIGEVGVEGTRRGSVEGGGIRGTDVTEEVNNALRFKPNNLFALGFYIYIMCILYNPLLYNIVYYVNVYK